MNQFLKQPLSNLVNSLNFSQDPAAMRDELFKIACTTLSSKILAQHKEFFAKLAVDAVLRLKVKID